MLLGLSLFVCGLTIATIEVAMNAKASQTERVLGRRIMTRCHAFWSFGTVAGAMLGGAFAENGVSFLAQQLVLQPLFAAASAFFALRLLADDPAPEAEPERGLALPSAALVLMCLVPIGALLIEGAMMEWSALLMREDKGAGPFVTALTFAVFALAMAVTRLAGDRLAEQFGPRAVILRSGLVMGVGIFAFGLAPGLWMSIPAAALVGIGCGNIYPLTMSMVGQVPGPRPERNVATLALVAFTAFLIGPPLIGALASVARAAVGAGAAGAVRAGAAACCCGLAAVDAGDGVGGVDADVQPLRVEVHGRGGGREEHPRPGGQLDVVQHVDPLADPVLVVVGAAAPSAAVARHPRPAGARRRRRAPAPRPRPSMR